MSYKCKRCGKTANYRSELKCYKCDTATAQAAGYDTTVYPFPPSYNDLTDTSQSNGSFSGDGGDFGGGGASSSWDSSSSSSSSDSGSGSCSGD